MNEKYELYRFTKSEDSEVNNLQILQDKGRFNSFTDAYYGLLEKNKQKIRVGDVIRLSCATYEWWAVRKGNTIVPMGRDKK